MKKITVIILGLIMVLSFTMLSACGGGSGSGSGEDLSDSKYVGTWKAENMSLGEETGEFENEVLLIVNGDGTGQMTEGDEVSNFNWEPTDDGFKVTGDVKTTFKDEDGGIVAKVIGVELHFVKAE